jgi:hypothetical protein
MNIISNWLANADFLIKAYNLNGKIFVIVYFLSIIPIYAGYFLMLYGAVKEVSIKNIFKVKLSGVKINATVIVGIIINIFGILMPYLYILIWGKNLSFNFYLVVFLIILILLLFFVLRMKNIFKSKSPVAVKNIEIVKKEAILYSEDKQKMWDIYDDSFIELNKHVPCRQSFDKVHFLSLMDKKDVFKYVVFEKNSIEPIGLGMITNNLENTPWISEEYFKYKFKDKFEKKLIYYFMGIAVADGWRHKGYASVLVKQMTDELPNGAIIGFDNSKMMNFFIPYFADKDGKKRKRKFLDSQNYYIVFQK